MVLRVLIGAACVAVVGFVGFAAWDRYEAGRAAEQLAEFQSFCELNYRVEGNVRRDGEAIPAHISEGIARCEAAGMPRGR